MFATNEERFALRSDNAFGLDFVVRFSKAGRDSEIACDDLDHALAVSAQWIDRGAAYVEIFRVMEDGSLKPTIGAHRVEAIA